MKAKPDEELAFGFRVCHPNLLSIELGETVQELNMVCRTSRVRTLRIESPGDGVRLLQGEMHGRYTGLDLQILRKLHMRGKPCDGTDPVVIMQLFGDGACFSCSHLE
jgi:hypothetical protein